MSTPQAKYKIGQQVETKVRSWMFGKTKGKGTKYVKILFDGYIEKTIWPWSPKAEQHAIETLETLGFKGKDISMLSQDNSLNKDKYFMATVDEVRVHEGKSYYSASWINDPEKMMGGFMDNKMTTDELSEYTLDTSGYIENAQDLDPPAATQSFDSSSPVDVNFASDDIPF